MIAAIRLLALVLALVAAAALVPTLASLAARDGMAGGFLATVLGCTFLSGAVYFSVHGRSGRMRRLHLFGAMAGLWVLVPLVAAPAIAFTTGMPMRAALLEAVSAFTTTGLTSVKQGPVGLFIWFALLQWSGGLLTIVTGIAVLAPAGVGGLPDRATGTGEAQEAIDLVDALRDVVPIYGAATLLAFVLLLLTGPSLYAAFCLATAVTSTGAHLPPEAHQMLAEGLATKWVMLPFLLWSATSVRWHKALASRRVNAAPEQTESLFIFGYWLVLGILLAAYFFRGEAHLSLADAVPDGLFAAASLISTTGLAPYAGAYAHVPAGLVLVVAFVGGGALSVAGGLKVLRVRAMLLRARGDLLRLVYPNLVQPSRTGEGGVGSAMRGVWVGAMALFMSVSVVLVVIASSMPSFDAALTAAVAVVSNTGPIYSEAGAGWPSLSALNPLAGLAAAFGMIAGRLETVGAFVLIHLAFWRN
ncbi:potassium transporter TrkH [Azorhizobium oxalatiphilum]|uniref:Potassium transporter TrkH n=1 Tax=Azorhizobium oxalatiphilum TaxID=980631 RepID=A0A917CC44_9HYPH|nr:TrkH family potassium uptake protein [Azorhizobium oxalatiphilum]GGF83357.1 potassium transporter TrkH [Azorhizobium oxalatiphilum]